MRVWSTQPGALPTPCFSQPQPCNSPGVATSSWVWQGKRGGQPFDTRRVTPELCWWAVLLWLFSVTVPNGTERLRETAPWGGPWAVCLFSRPSSIGTMRICSPQHSC